MREFSVSIGTIDSFTGNAWILTPSQRPELQGHWFVPGTRIEIFASPAPGYVFTHWTLNNLSTGNIVNDAREIMELTVRGNTIIVAHFSLRSPITPHPPIVRPPLHRPPVTPVPPHRPPAGPRPPIGTPPSHRPPVTPVPPPRPPAGPRPPIGTPPSHRPPTTPVPPPRPPVSPIPPIGTLPSHRHPVAPAPQ